MCSHFARCKRFTILVVNRGCGFLGPNMTEYTAALYIPLFVFDACLENNMSLWLTWLWWFFCFFHCSLSYLIRPLSFFPLLLSLSLSPHPRYRNMNLCIWLIWCGAYRSSMCCSCCLLHLSHLLYQHAVFWWRGEKLYLELTSPHTAVPEMKSGKIMFKSCRRCFAADAGYANPQPHKCWFFPKQLLLKRTLKYRNLLYSSRIYFTNSIVNSHSLLLSPFGCFSV